MDSEPSDVGYYTQFKGSVKPVSSEVYCTVNGRRYSVKNGENAVAFELRRGAADGDLLYFLICMGMIYLVELIWLMLSFMQSRPMGGV